MNFFQGNDDPTSQYSQISTECLDLIGRFSLLAKKDGFLVSMSPPESYLDPTTSAFDLQLNHNHPEWQSLQPYFDYHGRNAYAYLLINYPWASLGPSMQSSGRPMMTRTFDIICIQLYEGYSHALYATTVMKASPTDYIVSWARSVVQGWKLDIPCDLVLGGSKGGGCDPLQVAVEPSQLVIGLANGWAEDGKHLIVRPEEVPRPA